MNGNGTIPDFVDEPGLFTVDDMYVGAVYEIVNKYMPDNIAETCPAEIIESVYGLSGINLNTNLPYTKQEITDIVTSVVRKDYIIRYLNTVNGLEYTLNNRFFIKYPDDIRVVNGTLPDDITLNAGIDALMVEDNRRVLKNMVIEVSDKHTSTVMNTISGVTVSKDQLERYRHKVEIAEIFLNSGTNNTYIELLTPEATAQGITETELANNIIAMKTAWDNSMKERISLIETFRIKINKVIDAGDYGKAYNMIKTVKGYDINTLTDTDVASL